MAIKTVKELMISLSEYAVVPDSATIIDAIKALNQAQSKLLPSRQSARAVLVINAKKEAVLSVLSFLKNHGYSHLGLISCVDWIEEKAFL